MNATTTTASVSVWSAARWQRLPDDASSRARTWSRDETRESPSRTDIRPWVEKARDGAVSVEGVG
jgi:hypothetical protein